jgi:hypothetical protein
MAEEMGRLEVGLGWAVALEGVQAGGDALEDFVAAVGEAGCFGVLVDLGVGVGG